MKQKWVELHRHLDGAITIPIARRLSEISGAALPESDDALRRLLTVPEDCKDLNEFLRCFELPLRLMQTKESISEAVFLVLEGMKAEGILYGELRFAPGLHQSGGLTQAEVIEAALHGLSRASIPANLILCLMRGADNARQNLETIENAKEFYVRDGGVTALDLAGAEGLFPTEAYRVFFEKAGKYGIPFTIHAGEADGAESVRAALAFGASRIGHGVRIRENREVYEMVRDRKIPLEMCPTSNIVTGAAHWADYPLAAYLRDGLTVTVNTDDPAILQTDIRSEYAALKEKWKLSREQEKQLISHAISAAFTTEARKEALRKEIMTENT